jgi:hypothetical protein
MRMQEPQGSQESQQWQTGLEYGDYRANAGQYDSGQQQKIYPQEERGLMGIAAAIVTIVLSVIGFAAAIVGVVGSSIVLYYSNGQHYMLVGGIMGLIGSILLLILMVALFVVNVVTLARSEIRRKRAGRLS